jgi:hypothetical protein
MKDECKELSNGELYAIELKIKEAMELINQLRKVMRDLKRMCPEDFTVMVGHKGKLTQRGLYGEVVAIAEDVRETILRVANKLVNGN